MDDLESDEPKAKRRLLNSQLSQAMSPTGTAMDVSVLQSENQRLVQQSEIKKQEMHELHAKIQELNENQTSYDDELITLKRTWNQMNDDLLLLHIRAGEGPEALLKLNHFDYNEVASSPCSPEDVFLCQMLGVGSIQVCGNQNVEGFIEETLAPRQMGTLDLMTSLKRSIDSQMMKIKIITAKLGDSSPDKDAVIQFSEMQDILNAEKINLDEVINILRLKHEEYPGIIQKFKSSHIRDQSEIKHLEGNLEEILGELEETRRKLITLRMQKDAAKGIHTPSATVTNGNLSPEKPADKIKGGLRELRDSIEEAKILSDDRLSELQHFREENNVISKELESIQNEMKDEKRVLSSRPYNLLNDQFQHIAAEVERYKSSLETLQVERSFILRREKEISVRMESSDASKNAYDDARLKIEELELQLSNLITEKNNLEIELEEATQDSVREDIKAELHVMASALSKEMGLMEAQLKKWKETSEEACSLREVHQSLESSLNKKIDEERVLIARCAEQDEQIRSLKDLIEKTQEEALETQLILEMYLKESHENRDIQEINDSTSHANEKASELRRALEEHSLELRVKAANEAETTCQQRLAAAEAEIGEISAQLVVSNRDVWEVKEALKGKEKEAETYISEIETIGQAYEDMQTQNQHLLQQLAERDDYNIKLVSESVKMKQAHNSLLSEKQALAKQLQHYNASLEAMRANIDSSEEQMKSCVSEGMKVTDDGIELAIAMETVKWELMDAEKELKFLKHANSSSEKEDEQIQRKIDEACKELERERDDRLKLNEELKKLNETVSKLIFETGEVAIQRLQDEIADCKRIIKCSVCSDRPKEVVIMKCSHLFCNPCIQRNLEIRHRKCPACGTGFGQNDVKSVKIIESAAML